MGYEVTINEKGRIIIPKEIRDKLNLKKGSKVKITLEKNGWIVINVKRISVNDIYGIAEKERVKIKEIEEALGFEGDDWFQYFYLRTFSDPSYGEREKEILETAEDNIPYSSTLVISQVLAHLERKGKAQSNSLLIIFKSLASLKQRGKILLTE